MLRVVGSVVLRAMSSIKISSLIQRIVTLLGRALSVTSDGRSAPQFLLTTLCLLSRHKLVVWMVLLAARVDNFVEVSSHVLRLKTC